MMNKEFIVSTLLLALSFFKITAHTTYGQLPTGNLANGLIGYYSLSGNTLDSSGAGNDGIPTNLTYSTNRFGVEGASGNFSQIQGPVQSYVTIPNFSSLNNYPVTFSAWFTLNNLVESGGSIMTLIGKEAATVRNEGAVALTTGAGAPLYVNQIGYIGYSTSIQPEENFITSFTPTVNQWYNLIFTYNEDQVATFYVNGTQIAQQVYKNLPLNEMEFRIGSSSGGYFDINKRRPSWDGLIDDVAVYNRALTSTEVTELYNAQAVPEPSTYALLLLSGAASLWALRRRKHCGASKNSIS